MDEKLKQVLWSVGGLLVTLFIAWYFSHKNQSDDIQPTQANGAPPQLNFGGSPVTVPGLTIPPVTLPQNPAPTPSACCKRCVSPFDVSGGKILSSGNFTQETFKATQAIIAKPAPIITSTIVQPSSPPTPNGPMLLAQSNGGMPLPSENWWKADPVYRQAYILAYNQVVGQLAFTIQNQNRPAIPNLSMNLSDGSSGTVISAVQNAGQQQLARGGNDSRWLMEAQSNSMLFMQTMQTALNNWLKQMDDTNVLSGNIAVPPDQNESAFLIN